MYSKSSYLIHIGMPGRSGKKGGGLWYKNGELTDPGYRHYYMLKYGHEPSQQEVQNRSGSQSLSSNRPQASDAKAEKSRKIKKALKIAAGTAAVAAAGFIAYKKSTKLRDAMREEARGNAVDWLNRRLEYSQAARMMRDDAKLTRAAIAKNSSGELTRLQEHALGNSMRAQNYAKKARESLVKQREYEKVASTLTRRDAVKKHLKDKVISKMAERKNISDAIDKTRKNYLRSYKIRKYS